MIPITTKSAPTALAAGPSWVSRGIDAHGARLPGPLYPGYDTLATLAHLRGTGFDHSWFVLTQSILRKEFALSGSEQNPEFTTWRRVINRVLGGIPVSVKAFMDKGEDFIVERALPTLVKRMNALMAELVGGAPPAGAGAGQGGPPPQVAEIEARGKKAGMVGGLLSLMVVVIVILMVFKPGT